MLHLTYTLDKIYLTGIILVHCLQISLHNDVDNEIVYCTNKRIRSASHIDVVVLVITSTEVDNYSIMPYFQRRFVIHLFKLKHA